MGKRASFTLEGQRIEDSVIVFVDGRQYTAWKSVNLGRSLANMSGGFNISVYNRWQDSGQDWELVPNKEIQVQVGSDRIITGFIDSVSVDADSGSRGYTFSGRDKTADLIDCSVTNKVQYSQAIKLESLARDLLQPFGLNLKVEVETGAAIKPPITIQQGETVAELLFRESQKKGIIVTSDENSNVVLTRPGNTKNPTALIQGLNILKMSANYDSSSRYSQYILKGNTSATDEYFGIQASEPLAQSADPGVPRFRPLIVIAEGNVDSAQAKQRADWEATVRAAKSSQVQITVVGWFNGNNQLWKPNQLVRVKAGMIGINQEMLIESVSYNKDQGGTTSTLGLVRPDAYKVGPVSAGKEPMNFLQGFKPQVLEE